MFELSTLVRTFPVCLRMTSCIATHVSQCRKGQLVDVDDEPIIGKFYEEELSAINKTDDVYRVEKILRRRKGQALVKWAGYDSKHNSWIPIKDIQSLK